MIRAWLLLLCLALATSAFARDSGQDDPVARAESLRQEGRNREAAQWLNGIDEAAIAGDVALWARYCRERALLSRAAGADGALTWAGIKALAGLLRRGSCDYNPTVRKPKPRRDP